MFVPVLIVTTFVFVVCSYALAGAIDSRLQLRHPDQFLRLGNLVHAQPLSSETFRHMGRWAKFLLWEHFSLRDRLLSALCLLHLLLGVGIFVLLYLVSNVGAAV